MGYRILGLQMKRLETLNIVVRNMLWQIYCVYHQYCSYDAYYLISYINILLDVSDAFSYVFIFLILKV